MSYTSNLKEALLARSHREAAELAGFLHAVGTIHMRGKGVLGLSFLTEKNPIARHFYQSIKENFGLRAELKVLEVVSRPRYIVEVWEANEMLLELGLLEKRDGSFELKRGVPLAILRSEKLTRQYLVGIFLGVGYVSDPWKQHSFELRFQNQTLLQEVADVLEGFGLSLKISGRREATHLYTKNSEEVVDLLNILGLSKESGEYENIRIVKNAKSDANRVVNFETANIEKTIQASRNIIECIEYIQATRGLHSLPESLQKIAQLRWEEPDLSLKELGALCDPPISKSGVSNRLTRLSELCKTMKERP